MSINNIDNEDFDKAQGHWILARMGKKVLRPGGKELTTKLVESLNISSSDNIVEFAPGLGYTASLALAKSPKTYIGVDANENAVKLLKSKIKGDNCNFIIGNAAETNLEPNTKDKVYGEAMLTMHSDSKKSDIINEAHRILKKGGLYGIHEIALTPDNLDEKVKTEIQRELGRTIRVNARPLTESEWRNLLEKEGFKINKVFMNPMILLEPKRMIDDEGLLGYLKISFNILRYPKARKRILAMREVFNKHEKNMSAISIIAEKI